VPLLWRRQQAVQDRGPAPGDPGPQAHGGQVLQDGLGQRTVSHPPAAHAAAAHDSPGEGRQDQGLHRRTLRTGQAQRLRHRADGVAHRPNRDHRVQGESKAATQ